MRHDGDKPMPIAHIARAIGVSEDVVSETMKTAMLKVAAKLKEKDLGRDDLLRAYHESKQ